MSVDPLAGIVAGNADLAALIDAELASLAADAHALRALVVEGAVVTARVLPSNGLTDLIEIAGRRVAASLPPTVRPGDVLKVQVTGFDGERILLQIAGTGADAAVETGPPNAPLAPDASTFVAAPVVRADAPPNAPAAARPPAATAGPAASPADVRAPAGALPPPAISPVRPGLSAEFASAVLRANVAPTSAAPPPAAPPPAGQAPTAQPPAAQTSGAARGDVTVRAVVMPAGEPTSIEARLAAARATLAPNAPASGAATASATPAPRFVAPPQIAPKALAAEPEAPVAPRARRAADYAEPVTLLRALKLPVTPSTVASATTALENPDQLPAALAALERALPLASDDPHVATLRTLLAFVGRIDPRSPALATQIAAYVDHVVDGAEPKLATLLAAAQASANAPALPDEPRSAVPAALTAERTAALGADLKQTLLAVAADPATPAPLAPALAGALTALTAVQLNAAQTLAAFPDGIAFTIPLTTQHGTSNAHVSVKRDAPQGRGARLDAENFRIAFVLDTAHYGTVAIDLVTVGRDVTVDVRTEAAPAMRAFRDALGTLTARLESLRYRVASAGASLGTTSTVAVEAPPAPPSDPAAVVDRSA